MKVGDGNNNNKFTKLTPTLVDVYTFFCHKIVAIYYEIKSLWRLAH